MKTEPFELVGLIPAAGHARRLALANGSKELLPVPNGYRPDELQPVTAGLLQQMQSARCARVFCITRAEKADIAQAFGSGSRYHLPMAYLMIEDSWGPPFTLASAFKFAPGAGFAFGFPDIMVDPPDAMGHIASKLRSGSADVVMATFPASEGQGVDMADGDDDGPMTAIVPKEENPAWPTAGKTWLLAVWRPSFTTFFEQALAHFREQMSEQPAAVQDLPTGKIFAQALKAGVTIDSVHFPDGRFLDIGSPDRLTTANDFYQRTR